MTIYASEAEFQPPQARIDFRVDGLSVEVDGSGSSDADGTIVGYAWEFGDGASAQGATARHAYAREGSYALRLQVTDDAGSTTEATATVEVGGFPWAGILVVSGMVAAAAIAAYVVLRRRGRTRLP